MAVNLVKGENRKLDLNKFHVGLGWDVNEDASQFDFDLDVAAFMIGTNKKTIADDYLVFYNSENELNQKIYLLLYHHHYGQTTIT